VILAEAALAGLNDYFIAAKDPAGSQMVNDAVQGIKPGARRYRTITSEPRPVTVTRRFIDPAALERRLEVHGPDALSHTNHNAFPQLDLREVTETVMVHHSHTVDATGEDLRLAREALQKEGDDVRRRHRELAAKLVNDPAGDTDV